VRKLDNFLICKNPKTLLGFEPIAVRVQCFKVNDVNHPALDLFETK
jgi:hypothetical protein